MNQEWLWKKEECKDRKKDFLHCSRYLFPSHTDYIHAWLLFRICVVLKLDDEKQPSIFKTSWWNCVFKFTEVLENSLPSWYKLVPACRSYSESIFLMIPFFSKIVFSLLHYSSPVTHQNRFPKNQDWRAKQTSEPFLAILAWHANLCNLSWQCTVSVLNTPRSILEVFEHISTLHEMLQECKFNLE
jgi:hypothetical protein